MDEKKKNLMWIFTVALGIITFIGILLFPKKENKKELNEDNYHYAELSNDIEGLRNELKDASKKIISTTRENLKLKKELNDGKGQIKSDKAGNTKKDESPIGSTEKEEGKTDRIDKNTTTDDSGNNTSD